jgi:AAA+ ATPase superfamily predicted ATPase
MKNPFEYGGVVSGKAFCNRTQEVFDLLRAMENGEKLLMYAERRMGKTSLVKRALERISKKLYATAYIDLWPTDGEVSFVTTTAKSIVEAMSPTPRKLLLTAKKLFSQLLPSLTLADDGRPLLMFGLSRLASSQPALEEVLNAPARIAASDKKKVVIVFDEFQQLLEYETDLVERRLRSIIQKQRNVSYLFLGSRRHLIQKLFLNKSRPLYRMTGHYPLGAIKEQDWLPFISKKFLSAKKQINAEHVRTVCNLTQGHPFYTQHLCHALWELCEPRKKVTSDLIDASVQLLLKRESYAYTTLWDSLSMNQCRFLQGLASEAHGVKVFAADFIRRCNLKSPSNAQRAAEALLERDVIDRDNGSFIIIDRFFRIWIRQMHDTNETF